MLETLRNRLLLPRHWSGRALALLLACWVLAPDALAGCRIDHVTTLAERSGSLDIHRLSDLITDGSTTPAMPARPCTGPGCSRGEPMPIPAAFHDVAGPDHWAAVSPAIGLEPTFTSSAFGDEPIVRPSGACPSIFHPPPA